MITIDSTSETVSISDSVASSEATTSAAIHDSFSLAYVTDGISYTPVKCDPTHDDTVESRPQSNIIYTNTMMIYIGDYRSEHDFRAIMYASLATGESSVFCFDPLCDHNSEDCTAQASDFQIAYYGNSLYVTKYYYTEDDLIRMDKDSRDPNAPKFANYSTIDFLKINIADGKKELLFTTKDPTSPEFFKIIKGKLYYCLIHYDNDTVYKTYHYYDIAAKKSTQITSFPDGVVNIWEAPDNMMYIATDSDLYICDDAFENLKDIHTFLHNYSPINISGDYAYCLYTDKINEADDTFSNTLFLYNLTTDEAKELHLSISTFNYLCVYNRYAYFSECLNKGVEIGKYYMVNTPLYRNNFGKVYRMNLDNGETELIADIPDANISINFARQGALYFSYQNYIEKKPGYYEVVDHVTPSVIPLDGTGVIYTLENYLNHYGK